MIVYTEGKLLASSKEGFTDSEGVKVEYFVNVIKTEEGIMTVNSKGDHSSSEGQAGIVCLRLTEDSEKKNRFKVSIIEIRVGQTLGMPESEIH